MDRDDIFGLVRDLMKITGTILIARDLVSTSIWEAITGGALLIVPIIWSQITRMQLKTAIVKAAITGDPKIPGPLSPLSTVEKEPEK